MGIFCHLWILSSGRCQEWVWGCTPWSHTGENTTAWCSGSKEVGNFLLWAWRTQRFVLWQQHHLKVSGLHLWLGRAWMSDKKRPWHCSKDQKGTKTKFLFDGGRAEPAAGSTRLGSELFVLHLSKCWMVKSECSDSAQYPTVNKIGVIDDESNVYQTLFLQIYIPIFCLGTALLRVFIHGSIFFFLCSYKIFSSNRNGFTSLCSLGSLL